MYSNKSYFSSFPPQFAKCVCVCVGVCVCGGGGGGGVLKLRFRSLYVSENSMRKLQSINSI